MVGGLTPLYSPPEVFQGAPSNRSDQYSLAILYVEMLTGELPFDGANAAELTLQHLHDEPNLDSLPMEDRYVVARALSEDPKQRFNSCSELVEELFRQVPGVASNWSSAVESATNGQSAAARRPGPVTQMFDQDPSVRRAAASTSMLLDVPAPELKELEQLDPVDLVGVEWSPAPTVVIGVGGLAASVLRGLRKNLAKAFGAERLPAVRMLLLDTDSKDIARAAHGDPVSALRADETMCLPLKRPQDYREQADRLLKGISRRWLYNIPKSLRTEGLRPLGRLALADHARQTFQRIRLAIAEATDPAAVAESSERTSLEFRKQGVRVVVVSSITGGSGSGMSLDVGYFVRSALDKLGLGDCPTVGVFLHAASGDSRHCDLAKVNAHAWLTEFNHYHHPGAVYGGDESCHLPPLPTGRAAFDATYLFELAAKSEDQAPDAVSDEVQAVADYLYLDALTIAQPFFDACRREPPQAGDPFAPIRSFRLTRISASSDASTRLAADQLAQFVVLQWAGAAEESMPTSTGTIRQSNPPRETDQLVAGAAQFVGQLQLGLEGLASTARQLVEGQFGGDLASSAAALVAPLREARTGATLGEMLLACDAPFAAPGEHGGADSLLGRPLEAIVSPLTMKLSGDLARWVLARLDNRQLRLPGAKQAAKWLSDHLLSVEADAVRMAGSLARQINAAAEAGRKETQNDPRRFDERATRAVAYLRLRADHQAVVGAMLVVRRLLAEMKALDATITELGRHLKHLAKSIGGANAAPIVAPAIVEPDHNPVTALLQKRMGEFVDAVDGRLQAEFIQEQGGLFQTVMGHGRVRAQLLAVLSKISLETVEQIAADPSLLQSAMQRAVGHCVDAPATPSASQLLQLGGVFRQLIVIPQPPVEAGQPRRPVVAAQGGATIVGAPGNDAFVCCEAWRLPLPLLAADLIQSRRDYADFASRVHTRCDVAWTPLLSAATAALHDTPFPEAAQ